jgi:hypothetical protein
MTYLHLYRQKPFKALGRSKRKSEDKLMADPIQKRFGVVAIQKGFVTLGQVVDAFRIQIEEEFYKDKHRHLGEILLEQGLINQSQIGEVLKSLY